MGLLVLAYPEISKSDYERIQEFRKTNDELNYRLVGPHFTIVFPLPVDLSADSFAAEVMKQTRDFQTFDFCIRCAALNKDFSNEYYHTFLVPDEGYGKILKLHDNIYADMLFPYRLLQVDFIPHIGIGNSKEPRRCLEMVEKWNKTEFAIPGRIANLDVANYENNSVKTIQRIFLGK